MTLDHNDRDCCGVWKQQLISGRLYWRCPGCQAIACDCDAVAEGGDPGELARCDAPLAFQRRGLPQPVGE
jgi:hypothetical protein